ncbi:type IV pilus assembly protein PilX [Stenotrophomonas rhizophila]|jgi:type IV pilus assembly protein PilX|uniref:pilus assembly PilX family protein n=1 Tax=Stenotrophomonas rhizophila TaxID=216778 RepID=UPI001AEC36A3|nr:PilX N-terminal domain-containing pilus assembly protein [Stenotrophomonas rhizophila]
MNRPPSLLLRARPRQQRGAVLYVALIMLLLLALIGVAGMQVAGMQEKMAANYRASNRSFQNTEGVVRNAERAVEAVTDRTALPTGSLLASAAAISQNCEDGFDPVEWAKQQSSQAAPKIYVRQIDQCGGPGGNALDQGQPNDRTSATFQITAYSADDPANPTSSSVIDTIFKL